MQTELKQHNHHTPRASLGDSLSVFTNIYKDDVNIAIWQREQRVILNSYAQAWAE